MEKNEIVEKRELLYELTPERRLSDLILPDPWNDDVEENLRAVINEQHKSKTLHEYNLRAKNLLLFTGRHHGNGKTILAEALATELMFPLLVVRYESLKSESDLKDIFDYAKKQHCVLFFDNFSEFNYSLLPYIPYLPDYVVLVVANGEPPSIAHKFHVKVDLPNPVDSQLIKMCNSMEKRCDIKPDETPSFRDKDERRIHKFKGYSYSEIEEHYLDIAREKVLSEGTNTP